MSVDLRAIREEAKSGVVELSGDAALRLLDVCEAAEKLVAALDVCEPYIAGQFARNPTAYKGPTYGLQLDEARTAVRALGEGEGGEKRCTGGCEDRANAGYDLPDIMEREAYAAGFRAGQESMRERAANSVDGWIAKAIRALPIVEPDADAKPSR